MELEMDYNCGTAIAKRQTKLKLHFIIQYLCPRGPNGSPTKELEETTKASTYHIAEHHPARSERLQPHTEWSSRPGSEPSSVEANAYVWRYTLLVMHARKEETCKNWLWFPLIFAHFPDHFVFEFPDFFRFSRWVVNGHPVFTYKSTQKRTRPVLPRVLLPSSSAAAAETDTLRSSRTSCNDSYNSQ